MEQAAPFRALSLAIRRQASQLSQRTFTTERRVLFEAIVRLSYDSDSHAADVPSQAWLARVTGLAEGDASRGVRDLVAFGMIKEVLKSEGRRRVYAPQPDGTAWGGPKFHWRIADPALRAEVLREEMALAARTQLPLALEDCPTAAEEFAGLIQESHRQAALAAAGTLLAAEPAESPSSSVVRESPPPPVPIRGGKLSAAVRTHLRLGGHVPPSSAPVAQPAQEEPSLARQPRFLPEPWPSSQGTGSEPEGATLAGQPRNGSSTDDPAPSGAPNLGPAAKVSSHEPVRTLAQQPRLPVPHPRAHEPAPARHQTSTSTSKGRSISHQTSDGDGGAAGARMQDATCRVVSDGTEGRLRAPDELLRRVFAIVNHDTDRLVNYWRRSLGPLAHQRIALDLLGELKMRRDECAHGRGRLIRNEGAWLASEFKKRTAILHCRARDGEGRQAA